MGAHKHEDRSSSPFVVAIDGPSGAGKSTTARAVAKALNFHYLDSGALYRAVALAALDAGVALEDETALARLLARTDIDAVEGGRTVLVNGVDVGSRLRKHEVSQAASKVSAIPAVRAALIHLQRRAVSAPGAVVEGRDMATVVFPSAQLKVYLDADVQVRARRRVRELEARGQRVDPEEVLRDMRERDLRDRERAHAPLKIAPGALVIDSTAMGPEQVVARIVAAVGRARSRN